MLTRTHRKTDGRRLLLYGTAAHMLPTLAEGPDASESRAHLRWHPLRAEWIAYAAGRQERTFLPPAEFCPLCPTRPGGPPTEIPFEDFEVAVFENRFPAFSAQPGPPPDVPGETTPALGGCEVVVYTPEHTGSLGTLAQERRELLVRVWAQRYRDLYGREEVLHVMPFENRGEAVGVTLHHPHGQIYAYPFVPPVLQAEAAAFRREPVLVNLLAQAGSRFIVEDGAGAAVIVPPFARFPYETWVIPKRAQPGPWSLDDAEVTAVARALGRVVSRYDALFDRPLPYVMVLHAAPKGEEAHFHFHVEFYPIMRGPDRLKYMAGTELGAGTFTADVLPEDAAQALRAVEA